jgi:hypothetical protein
MVKSGMGQIVKMLPGPGKSFGDLHIGLVVIITLTGGEAGELTIL